MVERDFSIGETHKGERDLNSPLEARGLDYLRGFLGSYLGGWKGSLTMPLVRCFVNYCF